METQGFIHSDHQSPSLSCTHIHIHPHKTPNLKQVGHNPKPTNIPGKLPVNFGVLNLVHNLLYMQKVIWQISGLTVPHFITRPIHHAHSRQCRGWTDLSEPPHRIIGPGATSGIPGALTSSSDDINQHSSIQIHLPLPSAWSPQMPWS